MLRSDIDSELRGLVRRILRDMELDLHRGDAVAVQKQCRRVVDILRLLIEDASLHQVLDGLAVLADAASPDAPRAEFLASTLEHLQSLFVLQPLDSPGE